MTPSMPGPRLLSPLSTLQASRRLPISRRLLTSGPSPCIHSLSSTLFRSRSKPESSRLGACCGLNSLPDRYPSYSTSAIASTSSVGTEVALITDDSVFDQIDWMGRIQKKRAYADLIQKFAEHEDGPGWQYHLRRKLLHLAEAELEEESWAPLQALPQEMLIAADSFEAVIETLITREEILTGAKLMEDWIRFRIAQTNPSPQHDIPLSLLEEIIHLLTSTRKGQKETSADTSDVNIKALHLIRVACVDAGIQWTKDMNLSAGTAFGEAGLVNDTFEVLSAELRRIWQDNSSAPQDTKRTSQSPKYVNKKKEDFTAAKLLFGGLLRYLGDLRTALSSSDFLSSDEAKTSRGMALAEYFSLLASFARLLQQRFVPFKDSSPDDPFGILIRDLCRAPEFAKLVRFEVRQLEEPLRVQITQNMQVVSTALAEYIWEVVRPLTTKGELRPGQSPKLRIVQTMRNKSWMPSLLQYTLRYLPSLKGMIQQSLSGISLMIKDGGSAGSAARNYATMQLNEAVFARDPNAEKLFLELIFQQEGVKMEQEEEHVDIRLPFYHLLDKVLHQGDLHRVNVLLRYVTAGGRIRGGKPRPGTRVINRRIRLYPHKTLFYLVLPSLSSSFDRFHPRSPPPRDAAVLANSATCLALLQVASAAGNPSYANALYDYILWFRKAQPSGEQIVSLEEATCYLQLLENVGADLVRLLRRQSLAETNIFKGTKSSDELFADLANLRSHAKQVYEDLIDHWRAKDNTPVLDGRFFNALLGALLWPDLIRILHSPSHPTGEGSDVDEENHVDRRDLSKDHELLTRLLQDVESLKHLVVILKDMIEAGLKIPPGYRILLKRAKYDGQDFSQHYETKEQRKGRTLRAGKLAVDKMKGWKISRRRFSNIRKLPHYDSRLQPRRPRNSLPEKQEEDLKLLKPRGRRRKRRSRNWLLKPKGVSEKKWNKVQKGKVVVWDRIFTEDQFAALKRHPVNRPATYPPGTFKDQQTYWK